MTATAPARLPAEPPATVAGIAQPRVAPPPLIDPEVLDELRSMLGGEVDRLIDVFLEDTPRLITALENGAAGTPDYPALRDAAHSLKSSSANLGAMRSEEHKSELKSLMRISYAVFCL